MKVKPVWFMFNSVVTLVMGGIAFTANNPMFVIAASGTGILMIIFTLWFAGVIKM